MVADLFRLPCVFVSEVLFRDIHQFACKDFLVNDHNKLRRDKCI